MGKINLDNVFETSLFKIKSFGNLKLTKLIVPFISEQKITVITIYNDEHQYRFLKLISSSQRAMILTLGGTANSAKYCRANINKSISQS